MSDRSRRNAGATLDWQKRPDNSAETADSAALRRGKIVTSPTPVAMAVGAAWLLRVCESATPLSPSVSNSVIARRDGEPDAEADFDRQHTPQHLLSLSQLPLSSFCPQPLLAPWLSLPRSVRIRRHRCQTLQAKITDARAALFRSRARLIRLLAQSTFP
jgi:hypothetical protein